ncbi:hypothetical protein ACVWZV_007238 [Bradyrhizobium sp. GM5.1]
MPEGLTQTKTPTSKTPAGFKSECRPVSFRNGGRLQIGTMAGFKSEYPAEINRNPHALNWFQICGYTRVSHFVSMLLLALALTLTLCFGVAAWRVSAGNDVEITATIPHGEYGWRSRSRN